MIDVLGLSTAAVSGGGVTLFGQWIGEWVKGRHASSQHQLTIDAQLEEHKDVFLLDLLKAARAEISSLHADLADARSEVVTRRQLEVRLIHAEEALYHLDAVLNAINETTRDLAEQAARAFLARMKAAAKDVA